jgi:hypothetical protein
MSFIRASRGVPVAEHALAMLPSRDAAETQNPQRRED